MLKQCNFNFVTADIIASFGNIETSCGVKSIEHLNNDDLTHFDHGDSEEFIYKSNGMCHTSSPESYNREKSRQFDVL